MAKKTTSKKTTPSHLKDGNLRKFLSAYKSKVAPDDESE